MRVGEREGEGGVERKGDKVRKEEKDRERPKKTTKKEKERSKQKQRVIPSNNTGKNSKERWRKRSDFCPLFGIHTKPDIDQLHIQRHEPNIEKNCTSLLHTHIDQIVLISTFNWRLVVGRWYADKSLFKNATSREFTNCFDYN